jgi:hypothetical protein
MGNRISEPAAIENLKRLYGDVSSDFISIEDIFTNVGRTDRELESNRNWLYNKLSSIYPHHLFDKRFTVRNHTRALEGLVLTSKGREALGRSVASVKLGTSASQRDDHKPTFESVKADIETLRAEFPALKIIFDVRLNEEIGSR